MELIFNALNLHPIDITVSSPVKTYSPYDFVVAEVLKKDSIINNSEALNEDEFELDDNWGIYPIIEKNKVDISSGTNEIHLGANYSR